MELDPKIVKVLETAKKEFLDKKNDPHVVKKWALERLEKDWRRATLKLLGFESQYHRDELTIDHCNGRKSSLDDFIKNMVANQEFEQFFDALREKMGQMTPTKKEITAVQREYSRSYERRLMELARDRGKESADAEIAAVLAVQAADHAQSEEEKALLQTIAVTTDKDLKRSLQTRLDQLTKTTRFTRVK
jgi:hypothetical protein